LFFAWRLKNSTLAWLKDIVTFIVFALNPSAPGGGKKSSTNFNLPIGIFESIFLLIITLSFPPVTGTDYPDLSQAISKPHRQNSSLCSADTEKSLFFLAMPNIGIYFSIRVKERFCRQAEIDAMLGDIYQLFAQIPDELPSFHFKYTSLYG
jgi:hypothetical protein